MDCTRGEMVAIAAINEILEQLVAYGMEPESLRGVTDVEIDAMAAEQNAPAVPAAVRAMMRAIGAKQGDFQIVGDFYLGALDTEWKSQVLEFWDEVPVERRPFEDSEHMLVIADYQSSAAAVIDGARLTEPDPPVWWIAEDGSVDRIDSVTRFFRGAARGVESLIDRRRERRGSSG
ncbi:hypothetical protein [Nocardia bovistercoris]|uniref:SMI1/KNR4 family protein n=1 Tax=Nocardia bovistercoris TaxID=2785916 RepID=A0A931IAE5_9NOCA|nr:hypothetical protein [Nocardia bovistercoris]MBH0777001.1 hypothetical protein [Nocardia bovistercoris]